jgi:hypothetical protein
MSETKLCVVCRGILGDNLQEDTEYIKQQDEDFLDGVHICVHCARKDKLDKMIKTLTPSMEKFSKMVNRGFDRDGVVSDAVVSCFFHEHRFLQHEMILGLKKIITKIGEQSGSSMYQDGRNEWALKWCKEVSKLDVYTT